MESIGLLLIFWYGILHAFGPDHLTAIADFSIGKNKTKTLMITILFAFGHGISLFIFAKLLEIYDIPESFTNYGDIISSIVIFSMGIYLLFMVFTNQININKHIHKGKEHIHIYFGKKHHHSKKDMTSAFTLGILMGIGGIRGMLVTFALLDNSNVDFLLVFIFTFGVMIVFILFGLGILYINKNLLKSEKNIKIAFTSVGIISLIVGSNILMA